MDAFARLSSCAYPIRSDWLEQVALRGATPLQAVVMLWCRLVEAPDMRLPDDDLVLASVTRLTPDRWRRARARIAHLLDCRDGMVSLHEIHGSRIYHRARSDSGLFGKRVQELVYFMLKPAHASPGESNAAALERREREIEHRLRANDELRERAAEAWAAHYRYKGQPVPSGKSKAATRHEEIREWLNKRIEAVRLRLERLGIRAGKVHRSAMEWLIRRHLEGFTILYSDLFASLVFGDRFLTLWPRDGPPG
ncbi:MAG: hypothetical protein KDH19_11475 [Geminicoccaceae bacterium]|nr:hypothetical protein [Geminicoccaceae bacterium]